MGNTKVRCYFDCLCCLYYLGMKELVLCCSFMVLKYHPHPPSCLFPHYVGLGKRIGGKGKIIYRGTPVHIFWGDVNLYIFRAFWWGGGGGLLLSV